MKLAFVVWISIAGFAQQTPEPQPGPLRRLDSVTWDLKTHTLSWVVQRGKEENGEFVPTDTQRYQITPDNATMAAALERRPVDEDEAKLVHQLLDTLSIYCARSVVWWEHSSSPSEPTDSDSAPAFKPERPTRQNEEPAAKPAPVKPVKAVPLLVGEAPRPLPR